ncbi:hypothetical protein LCGC14_0562850 [marine sediment metagenome]|uniref:site-specific DNA-methyltransferase (adenine-specific) n=1 Tax=marine sediment metagenome TaxID=412755 RepID=A0A0F9RRS6_9ZZZZ
MNAPHDLPPDAIELMKRVGAQVFGSPAGKSRLAGRLIPLFPEHKSYVEAFAGGAAVFWAKTKVETEVLNDLDTDIAEAFKFIRDMTPAEFAALKRMSWKATEQLFNQLKKSTPTTKITRFYKLVMTRRMGFMRNPKGGIDRTAIGTTVTVPDRLEKAKERLKGVKVFSSDYRKVMKQFDGPATMFFLDPPYVKTDQNVGEKKFDHDGFWNFLKTVKSKFIVTYDVAGPSNFKTQAISHSVPDGRGNYKAYKTFVISNFATKRVAKQEPTSTEVQTIIFDKEKFSLAQARQWLKDNDFKTTFDGKGVDEKPNSFRFRQRNPGDFQTGSFRTITLAPGVKAVIGRPKENKASHTITSPSLDPGGRKLPAQIQPKCPPGKRYNSRTGRCENIKRVAKMEELLKSLGHSMVLRSNAIVVDAAGILINGPVDPATRELIESFVQESVPEEHRGRVHFHEASARPTRDHMPLFDLALVPSKERRLIKISSMEKILKGFPNQVPEAGVHVHNLIREAKKTQNDGRHIHLFVLADGTRVVTEEDGEHEHTMSRPTANETIPDSGLHVHKVLINEEEFTTTEGGGGHDHELQVMSSAFDGIHSHGLKLDGKSLTSIMPGEFWADQGKPEQQRNGPAPPATQLARLAAIEKGSIDPADVILTEKREDVDGHTIRMLPIDKAEEDKHIVLGIVLEPDEVDAHEDTVKPVTIERAAHGWLARFQNRGLMHRKNVNSVVEIFESYIAPINLTIGGQKVKKGSWLVMYHVLDKSIWKKIKSGEFRGFSMGGFARRVKLRED